MGREQLKKQRNVTTCVFILFLGVFWGNIFFLENKLGIVGRILVGVCCLPVAKGAVEYWDSMEGRLKRKIPIFLYSALFAAAMIVQHHIVYTGNQGDSYEKNYIMQIGMQNILFFFLFSCVCGIVISAFFKFVDYVYNLTSRYVKGKDLYLSVKFIRGCSFLLLVVFWSFFWMTHFPGTAMRDSLRILSDPLQQSRQHTLFYDYILYGAYRLGEGIGGIPFGIAGYAGIQILYAAGCVSYCIGYLYKRKCPVVILAAIQLFFSMSAMIANISVVAVKDALFSFTLLLYIPLLVELIEEKGRGVQEKGWKTKFVLISIAIVLLRNNGVYVVSAIMIGILAIYKEYWKKIFLISAAAVMLPVLADNIIMDIVVDSEKDVVESLAVPLQQIAMTVVEDGKMSVEQREYIEEIMPSEMIRKYYAPCSVDQIKWGEGGKKLNKYLIRTDPGKFLKNWAQILIPNFKSYVKAYLLLTYGYWGVNVTTTGQGYYDEVPSVNDKDTHIFIESLQLWEDDIKGDISEFYHGNKDLYSSGNLIWMILLLCVYCVSEGKAKKLLVFLPVISVWITLMMSVPITNAFRYVYSLLLSLPFLMYLALERKEKEK